MMKSILLALTALTSAVLAEDVKPLRVLLVTGGCCHDYAAQHKLLGDGLSARANLEFTFAHNDDKSTKPTFEPWAAKARTMSAPMPVAPPVTKTTRPARLA